MWLNLNRVSKKGQSGIGKLSGGAWFDTTSITLNSREVLMKVSDARSHKALINHLCYEKKTARPATVKAIHKSNVCLWRNR